MKPSGSSGWKLVIRLLLPKEPAQFHSGFVQLRLGSPNRAAQHPGDLFVFVSLNIVQGEDRAVAGRQLTYGLIERYAIHYRHRIGVFSAFDDLDRSFAIIRGLLHLDATLAKMHQDLIDSQPVQPGGKSRLTTKASNFSKELNEDFLCEVLSLRDIAGHPQAERINPAVVPLVKLLKGSHVALSRFLSQRIVRFLLRLGFGCGHVFVLGSASQKISIFSACATIVTSPRISKERQPSLSIVQGGVGRPQRGCDAAL